MGSLLPPILIDLPYVILVRDLVIYFHCTSYFRKNVALTDIDLNMEFDVIKPHTERRQSTGQSRTKHDIAF